MNITIVGSRYFGQEVLGALTGLRDVTIARVVTPTADDRLAKAAIAQGIESVVHADPHLVTAEHIPAATDLIVTAHSHARVTPEALAKSLLGAIGYHPSLLPRHRGMAAIEWTIKEGDPIAGGSIYHLAERMDAGPLAAQDWCFVRKGETARELWERALAPMGLRLLREVVGNAAATGAIPATPQQEEFATKAPALA
jgi:methionyl-tRNA formyltransferase